ncbi:MAG: NAAT family transporter [Burkholderiales bacterium]|nr:NAAT family transporter [Burkholderiales bacterium]
MQTWTEYTRFLIALTAVLDPFLAVPMFLSVTSGRGIREQKRTARLVSVTVLGVLLVAALTGETILRLMGSSLASFRVGGGLVLLLMAIAMLNAQAGNVRQTTEEAIELESGEATGIVPLAIPLLAGPGAISMVIIATQHGNWLHYLTISACVLGVCGLLWLMLSLATPIGRAMGNTGMNIANRLLGLLLAGIAVETIAIGLKQLFPILGGG